MVFDVGRVRDDVAPVCDLACVVVFVLRRAARATDAASSADAIPIVISPTIPAKSSLNPFILYLYIKRV